MRRRREPNCSLPRTGVRTRGRASDDRAGGSDDLQPDVRRAPRITRRCGDGRRRCPFVFTRVGAARSADRRECSRDPKQLAAMSAARACAAPALLIIDASGDRFIATHPFQLLGGQFDASLLPDSRIHRSRSLSRHLVRVRAGHVVAARQGGRRAGRRAARRDRHARERRRRRSRARSSPTRPGRTRSLQVPPGAYTLTAELPGFQTASAKVTLQVNTPATLDLKMELGGITEVGAGRGRRSR